EETVDAPFTRAGGSAAQVPMMHLGRTLRYAESPGWQAVELPYRGGKLAMWVLVPTGNGAPGELLAPQVLAGVSAGLRKTEVDVAMPRWDFATSIDLAAALDASGMPGRFPLNSADFSGMIDGGSFGQAVHRATITVAEWGTEAAAVTGIAVATSARMPAPVRIVADHPFAFAIVDVANDLPLFIGQVADPNAR